MQDNSTTATAITADAAVTAISTCGVQRANSANLTIASSSAHTSVIAEQPINDIYQRDVAGVTAVSPCDTVRAGN